MAVYTQVLDSEIDDVGVLLSNAMQRGRLKDIAEVVINKI
jgi:hypothetical protein